ncbi:MAG TPA: outer membrane protein assembly factor BamE [Ideonella sp.]|uniref:outer membrane protein assembly factor BamE n=1 Tax=Ideonella sp. TaxID=1929293 RepID=UPI002BB5F429|nr:outer membrane protein assembly factor BamE [Ideonella sp.]HSI52011.1 outer membrane protein assembly factor BamE [Ideonella sp.]
MPLLSSVRPVAVAAALMAASLLGGCAYVSRTMSEGITSVITPYKVEIVQGNVVTSEQIAQIKPGRSRNDVRDILGSPLLADPFHGERWDYVFTLRRPGTEAQKRSVVIRFKGDTVETVDAPPDMPSEREFVASITRYKADPSKERKLMLTDEERGALPLPPAAAASTAAAPTGPTRSYPPLETL